MDNCDLLLMAFWWLVNHINISVSKYNGATRSCAHAVSELWDRLLLLSRELTT